jgi:hypothetical protein
MKKLLLIITAWTVLALGCGGAGSPGPRANKAGTRGAELSGPPALEPAASLPAVPTPLLPEYAARAREETPPPEPPLPGSAAAADTGKILEIKEKMFIAQTNDVYLNQEDYLGRTIKLEGLFKREQYAGSPFDYCFVLRYGPGCCGSDGNAGFEVAWDAEAAPYPAIDDWVEAVGTLKTYEEDGYPYLYIALSSLRVLDRRGAEFVTQ